jgi:hypothetical protein
MPYGPFLAIIAVRDEKAYSPAPNPFRPSEGTAVIVYSLSAAGRVIIDAFDIAGNKVAVFVDGERNPGTHQFRWNGGNGEFDAQDGQTIGSGNKLAKGIYILRFKLPMGQYFKKVAIIK